VLTSSQRRIGNNKAEKKCWIEPQVKHISVFIFCIVGINLLLEKEIKMIIHSEGKYD
jgi:hypothetical protein